MQRPPRDRRDPKADRREHGRLRHRRLAPGPCARPQRPGRPAGRLLRRLDRGHGHARSPPGRQGRLAPGLAGRHVPGRRLPPQRRVPPELRFRVRRDDGDDQGEHELPLRRVRHLRVVPPAGAACDGQREGTCSARIPTWNDFVAHPNYDAFWRRQAMAPYLTRREGAGAPRRRLVGPGGLLRAPEDLRDPRAPRRPARSASSSPGRGTTAAGCGRAATPSAAITFGSDTVEVLPGKDPGARSSPITSRTRPAGTSPRPITFETGANEWRVYDEWPPRRLTEDRGLYFREDGRLSFEAPAATDAAAFDSYVSDPARPGALPAAADRGDLRPARLGLADLARRRPALRPPAARRPELGDASRWPRT
ncbi:MAG: hypothetical protein M0C28_03085 [Candidatus Moduliflexus flocculans]|nr:hypothetical protein [Candidatus Moduliflexus flocculans]